jgi:uncharacterized protein
VCMATRKSEEDPHLRLPIKLDSSSNGEYWPIAPDPTLGRVVALARESSETSASKLNVTRREYLASACGAATVLLGMNQLGCGGGSYRVPPESTLDRSAAESAVAGDEFIFDVQTHQVSPDRPWWDVKRPSLADFLKTIPQAECGQPHWARCFTDDVLIREVFLESDTQLAVVSALWGDPHPMLASEAEKTREKVQAIGKGTRLLTHGIVQPNEADWQKVSEHMQDLVENWKIDAWKLYTVWGPNGEGYQLDDALGAKTIARGLELGRRLFAVHKGLPLPGMNASFTSPRDVGKAAKAFPDAVFLIYHSGWEAEHVEGPYDPKAERGVDALIRSLEENGIGPQGNVYAELGSTWRELMKKPDQAAHVLGKLLKYVGENRILWGTDAIWYGSPQDQIQAFRAFEISPEYQEKYGYPALTKERKAKIFGLNAATVYGVDVPELRKHQATDTVSRARPGYAHAVGPSFHTHGPRTRREMLSLLASGNGH